MSDRLISADRLKDIISDTWILDRIDEQPTVDAVEVVRCKNCVYSRPFTEEELKAEYRVGEWYCEFWCAEMHEDDYCSCGKRREDETN